MKHTSIEVTTVTFKQILKYIRSVYAIPDKILPEDLSGQVSMSVEDPNNKDINTSIFILEFKDYQSDYKFTKHNFSLTLSELTDMVRLVVNENIESLQNVNSVVISNSESHLQIFENPFTEDYE